MVVLLLGSCAASLMPRSVGQDRGIKTITNRYWRAAEPIGTLHLTGRHPVVQAFPNRQGACPELKEIKMIRFLGASALVLSLASGVAWAQSSSAMGHNAMGHNAMGHSAMSHPKAMAHKGSAMGHPKSAMAHGKMAPSAMGHSKMGHSKMGHSPMGHGGV